MAFTFGTPVASSGFSSTLSVTITSIPAGSVVLVQGFGQGAAGASQSASDGTNTYTLECSNLQTGNNGLMAIFSHYYASAQASITVTVTGSVSSLLYIEGNWYGSAGVTGTSIMTYNGFPGTGANIVTSGSVTPGVNGSTLVGFAYNDSTASVLSAGTSPNAFTSITLASTAAYLEYFTQTTAAAAAATFGLTTNSSVYAGVVALQPAAGSGFTLALANGSFSMSGQAATFASATTLAAAAGSFSMTGQAATLTLGGFTAYQLLGAPGSFFVNGAPAFTGYGLDTAAGSFAFTGQNATLLIPGAGYLLPLNSGAFAFTSLPTSFTHGAAALPIVLGTRPAWIFYYQFKYWTADQLGTYKTAFGETINPVTADTNVIYGPSADNIATPQFEYGYDLSITRSLNGNK